MYAPKSCTLVPSDPKEHTMAPRQLKQSTIRSLAAKLDGLQEDLSPDEAAVLAGLIGLAGATFDRSHAEVEPTAAVRENAAVSRPADTERLPAFSQLLAEAFRPDTSAGPTVDPSSPLADSIGVGWLCVSWSKDYSLPTLGETEIDVHAARPELSLRIEGLQATQD